MKLFFIKLVVFISFVFILLKVFDLYYTSYLNKHKNVCEKSDWILNHKNQRFDFAFIGNSRVINMIDINTIEKAMNKKGINLGLIGANYAENYLVLNQFLKLGNKVKNLVIQVDMHSLNSTKELSYPFHNYNYMHLLEDPTSSQIIKDNNPLYKFLIWKYIPFTRYMEFSNKYVFYKILKGGYECKTSDFDSTQGTSFLIGPYDPNKQPCKYTYWTMKSGDEAYLYKLVELARKNAMQVIFYSAPLYYKYNHYLLGYQQMLADVKQESKKMDIVFFDFSKTTNPLCRDVFNFNDNIHLNSLGAKKFSVAIIDSIAPLLNL